jgi:hypothetical protein
MQVKHSEIAASAIPASAVVLVFPSALAVVGAGQKNALERVALGGSPGSIFRFETDSV